MRITVVATGLGDDKKDNAAEDILSTISSANVDDDEYISVLDVLK